MKQGWIQVDDNGTKEPLAPKTMADMVYMDALQSKSVKDALGALTAADISTNETGVSVQDALGMKVQCKLLYTNASPASAFPLQTIALDLSNYSTVIIEYYANALTVAYRPRYCIAKGAEALCVQLLVDGTQISRYASASNTGILFSECYTRAYNTAGTGYPSNTYMVPFKIFGVKGV